MKFVPLALALFLTSCASASATPQSTPAQVMSGASSTPAMAYPATPDISALQDELFSANQKVIDAQNIVDAKQAEIDRMDRQRLEFTVTAEYGGLVIAGYTQSAYSTNVAGTQTSIPITQTAFPPMATMQKQNSLDRTAELKAQEDAPDLLIKQVDAQQYQRNAKGREAANFTMKGFICLAMLAATLYYLTRWGIAVRDQDRKENTMYEYKLKDLLPIPPAPVDNSINCTNEQLVLFAEGIENDNKTMAFRQWERTPVYSRLKYIREFMTRKQEDGTIFAVPAGSFGELETTEAGRGFLNMVITLKAPPSPYRCAETSEEKDE